MDLGVTDSNYLTLKLFIYIIHEHGGPEARGVSSFVINQGLKLNKIIKVIKICKFCDKSFVVPHFSSITFHLRKSWW